MKALPLLALAGLVALGGCDSIREAAGLTKKSPDEFAVSTKAPLVVPPNFNLRPPQPGAAPITATDPGQNAQSALFGANDPQTVAANMKGDFSPAEKMLLANAGTQNADPTIRTVLAGDDKLVQGSDDGFATRVLGPAPPPQKLPANQKKKQSGWFDWL